MIRITTLPNGARIVTEVVESVYSAAIDLWIEVGSAYENTSNSGVSHFIEHMLFKGTTTRSAERLMEEIEDVGGMLSASTSREITKLYGHMLGDCLPVAVDIMLDMVQNPLFAQADLALERKVILDEIDMYDDDPGDVAQELVYQHLWQGSPQAMPITGDSLAVKAMSRETLLSYYKQFYRPERMIVSVAGNFDEEATIKSLSQKLMDFDASSAAPRAGAMLRPPVPKTSKFRILEDWETEMAQLIIAMPGLKNSDKLQTALQVLDLCLTTSASSRLFKEVREKRGLAYNIGSLQHSYRDCGLYGVAAAVNPANAAQVYELIFIEFERLKKEGLTEREILRAKNQLRTDLLMDKESMTGRSTENASDLLFFDRLIPLEERQAEIDAVANEQIIELAKLLFTEPPSVVLVGPQGELQHLIADNDIKNSLTKDHKTGRRKAGVPSGKTLGH